MSSLPDSASPAVAWLRRDLRLDDNPVVTAASADGRPVVVLFVLDEVSTGVIRPGAAARWWLHGSLESLAADVAGLGGRLVLRRGAAAEVVPRLLAEVGADRLVFARRPGRAERLVDEEVVRRARAGGVATIELPGNLLYEPEAITTASGTPFRVFTPFWRACRAAPRPRLPIPAPRRLVGPTISPASDPLSDWRLLPRAPDWSGGLAATWHPGEAGARARLADFVRHGLGRYAVDRDRPDLDLCSHLSPHLAFGEISPQRIVATVEPLRDQPEGASGTDVDRFFAELGWREFAHHVLHHVPDLATRNLQPAFDAFPWRTDDAFVEAWRRGLTGYPLVDAGMRELERTGTMHNRVRMVTASFLIKHGLVDWRIGRAWFDDELVDACPANNPAGWQWVAGSGADAAPFFRIFNPVAQGEKFDPEGDYVRRFLPRLARLPNRVIHAPWTASPAELADAGLRLGVDLPLPIVDHARARARALAAHATMRRAAAGIEDDRPRLDLGPEASGGDRLPTGGRRRRHGD
jgi:deoxyribodipyrimidine photo-lyase